MPVLTLIQIFLFRDFGNHDIFGKKTTKKVSEKQTTIETLFQKKSTIFNPADEAINTQLKNFYQVINKFACHQ